MIVRHQAMLCLILLTVAMTASAQEPTLKQVSCFRQLYEQKQPPTHTYTDVVACGNAAFFMDSVDVNLTHIGDYVNIIDLSKPSQIVQSAQVKYFGEFLSADKSKLYIHGDGLEIYDTTNPLALNLVYTYKSILPYLITYDQDRVYALVFFDTTEEDYYSLQLLDITNPEQPSVKGTFRFNENANVEGFAVAESNAIFLLDETGHDNPEKIQLFDLSNPSSSIQMGHLKFKIKDYPEIIMPLQIMIPMSANGHLAEIAAGKEYKILDFSNPAKPVFVGQCKLAGTALYMTLSGALAFVAETNGIEVIDISNPEKPRSIGRGERDNRVCLNSFFVRDNKIFLIDFNPQTWTNPTFKILEYIGPMPVTSHIEVLAPAAAQTLRRGANADLFWRSYGEVDKYVDIDLYRGYQKVRELKRRIRNDGRSSWTVPRGLTPGADYRIKISDHEHPAISGFSAGTFAVTR